MSFRLKASQTNVTLEYQPVQIIDNLPYVSNSKTLHV